jgi:hypothetical protein
MDFNTFLDALKEVEHAGDPFLSDFKRVVHAVEGHVESKQEVAPADDTTSQPNRF